MWRIGLQMRLLLSGVAWQLTLSCPKNKKETDNDQIQGKNINANDGELCILMFRPLIGSDKAEIEFMKQSSFSPEELDALASVLQLAGQQKSLEVKARGDASRDPSIDKTVSSLEGMGVKVYGLTESNVDQPKADISWDNIAGYNHQKRHGVNQDPSFSFLQIRVGALVGSGPIIKVKSKS